MPKSLANAAVKLGFLATAPADFAAVTVTELAAGKDWSDSIVRQGYSLGAAAADKVSEPSLASELNVSVPGNSNYNAQMDFFRYLDAEGKSVTTEDSPYLTLTGKGVHGYLVERVGPKSSAPWTAGDVVDIFEVVSDDPQPQKDYTGYVKFSQGFHVQKAYHRVVLV